MIKNSAIASDIVFEELTPASSPKPHVLFESNRFQQEGGVLVVPCNQLVIPSRQLRRYFEETQMQQLVTSIQKSGILQPLLVRPMGDNYEIVVGKRRYLAALEAGLTAIPVMVKAMTDAEVIYYTLVENLQRSDLNPVEETEGILELLELSLEADRAQVIFLLNQMSKVKRGLANNVIRPEVREAIFSVFQTLGRFSPESFRTNRLPLLNLAPEILDAIREGHLEYTKAKAIARVKDSQVRGRLLEDAIAHSLSLSEIKERISQYQAHQKSSAPSLKRELQSAYAEIIKSKVWDDPSKREELSALLAQMRTIISPASEEMVQET